MLDIIIGNLGWIILIAVLLGILSMGFRTVRPLEKGVIERLGRYKCVADQGFHVIIPIIDKMYRVNLTERMMDVEPQEIITEDNLNANVDLVVYYKVKRDDESVKKSIYNVDDFEDQIVSLAQTTARDVIGTMAFKDVNSKRSELNTALADTLDKESDAWGVEIVRVEMKEITPPEDVQDTMNNILKAENDKRSAIDFATAKETEADGERRAAIKKAEGEKRAEVLTAEGKAKGIKIVADANAHKIKVENEALIKHFKAEAQEFKRLETVIQSLRDNTKFVIDPNSKITNVISDMAGSTIIPIGEKGTSDIQNITNEQPKDKRRGGRKLVRIADE